MEFPELGIGSGVVFENGLNYAWCRAKLVAVRQGRYRSYDIELENGVLVTDVPEEMFFDIDSTAPLIEPTFAVYHDPVGAALG